jgi:hypothetical protein
MLVYLSRTLEEHIKHIKKVLHKLYKYKLYIQRAKSEFYITKTKLLRFIILRD